MNDYCPGAEQSPQPGGGGLDASIPPRATWHITWDRLDADGHQPQFSAVSNYLKNQGYCPHIMWDPFTGYMEQYYPASQSARALAAWNQDGAVNIQIETFFTPGCIRDGVKYDTVADTPLVGLSTLLEWLDGFGIPRVWPMGAPQWQGNSRDPGIWNTKAGHYGHCNVPDNNHTDPGPMPDFGTVNTASANIQEAIEMGKVFLAKLHNDPQVWRCDGMFRLPVWTDDDLKGIRFWGANGSIDLANNGEIQSTHNLNQCGLDYFATIGKDVNGQPKK